MDDRLRAFDRAARAVPSDHEAAWALVRALDQAGDDVGAWRARSRLARAGADEAWRQLEELPRGVRLLGARRVAELPEDHSVRGANDHGVLVVGASSSQVWDPLTLEQRWADQGPVTSRALALCGPLVVDALEPRLLLRVARNGEVLARVPLPFAPTSRPQICGGFAMLDTGGAKRRATTVVDLLEAEPRATPQRVEVEARTIAATRGLRLLAGDRGRPRIPSLLARTIPDHEARWSMTGHILAHDSMHVVTRRDPQEGDPVLLAVAAATGEQAWERTLDTGTTPIEAEWTPDALVVAANWIAWQRAVSTSLNVYALDRATGETRWRLREEVGPHVVVRLVATRDVLVVAYGPPRPSPLDRSFQALGRLTICGVDLATGKVLWTCAPAPREASSLTSSVGVFALDRGLLVWLANEDGRYLVRFDAG